MEGNIIPIPLQWENASYVDLSFSIAELVSQEIDLHIVITRLPVPYCIVRAEIARGPPVCWGGPKKKPMFEIFGR